MAKKPAKTRKAAVAKSAAERKFVKTGDATKAMQKLLDELNEAKRGETGWSWGEEVKVETAAFLLDLTIKKLKCPPTQSYPGSGLQRSQRRVK